MENKLEFVKRFISGDQNIGYSESLGVVENMKQYWWQSDQCFNLFLAIKKELLEVVDEEELANLVMQLVPYQYNYNIMMNGVSELVNRLVYPEIVAEDGSIDIDDLEEEGLCPGKIIVLRRGYSAPKPLVEIKPEAISAISEQAVRIKSEFYELAKVLLADAVSNKRENPKEESV